MSAPGIRAPGQVTLTTDGAGQVDPAETGEFQDLLPPDDAQPIALVFRIVGAAGPGLIRIYRCTRAGALGQIHVPDVAVPAVLPADEYTFTFARPIPNGGLRFQYTNNSGATVSVSLAWTYQAPGRR